VSELGIGRHLTAKDLRTDSEFEDDPVDPNVLQHLTNLRPPATPAIEDDDGDNEEDDVWAHV